MLGFPIGAPDPRPSRSKLPSASSYAGRYRSSALSVAGKISGILAVGPKSGKETCGVSTGRLPESRPSEEGNNGRGAGEGGCVIGHDGEGVMSRAGFRNVLYVEPRDVYL